MFTIANVGMWISWHDHTSSRMVRRTVHIGGGVDLPERIGIRDINDVLGILPGLQILGEDRS